MDIYDTAKGEKIKNEIGLKNKKVKIGLRATEVSQMELLNIPLV